MTGWRIGYAAGPEHFIKAMKTLQSQSTSCPNTIAQYAAEAALMANPESFLPPLLTQYKDRHDYLVKAINNIPGLEAIPTQGAFYLFVDATALIDTLPVDNDVELATFLLEHARVAVVPGSAFGTPNHIRLSFATSMEALTTAIERITTALIT